MMLTDVSKDMYEKKSYVLDLFLDSSEKDKFSVDEIMEADVIGKDVVDVSSTIGYLLFSKPEKYVFHSELKDGSGNSVDEYLLNGGTILNVGVFIKKL